MSEPNAAERLYVALTRAAGSPEYKSAFYVGDHETAWRLLADNALRELPPVFAEQIPHGRIPGFLEANSELAETIGKRLVLVTEAGTDRVTQAYLEPAVIVDDMIYAADEDGKPITALPAPPLKDDLS